ncbi:hypothetical protein [Streptomonospora litoralis]|uniref:Lipoprotein n=1 Tax=Streptomonospora litoralis TaxID=2498135 RepID=A0A4P6Q5G7_9ACTN|nr:hypothetical protein [Streptomonospora litoralis]QBI55976.1 hypothetical protein EKD16_21085 [Streptomonospora litoralis]
MQIPRQPRTSAALAAALVSLTACGGAGDASEEAPASTASAEPSPSPTAESGLAGLVDALAETTAESDSFTLEASATQLGTDSGTPSVTSTYHVQGADSPDRVTSTVPGLGERLLQTMRMTGQDPGLTAEELSSVTMIIDPDGGEPIISNSHGAFPGGTEWVRGLDGVQAPPPPPLVPGDLAPLLEELADEELVAEKGSENVGGVTATLVEGELEQAEVEGLGPGRETVEGMLGGAPADVVGFSAWIGEDGAPVRVEVADAEVEVAFAFSDVGSTSFEMPGQEEIHRL